MKKLSLWIVMACALAMTGCAGGMKTGKPVRDGVSGPVAGSYQEQKKTIAEQSAKTKAAMSSYTTKTTPVGNDTFLISDSEASNATKKATLSSTRAALGLGTADNPSFNSLHATGGNLAANNRQVTKAWQSGLSYTADVTSVIHGGKHWIAKTTHTAGSTTEPGVGASYTDAWKEDTAAFDEAGDYTPTGAWDFTGATVTGLSGGSMVYPGAGVPNSTGSAWGTSYTVGTGANNLVQLNGSSQLPAVSAALLTNFPTLNQNTTGTAAGLSAQYIDWNASSGGASIANKPTLGTAAQYNVGTGANNIIQLNSSGQLPFTIDVSDLTDTDGLFTAKANASCFASESAFNACFDLTWASGSTPPSGTGIVVVSSGAYGTPLTLDTDLSSVSASDDSVPSAKATKAAIDAVTLGGVTVQADDPTSASAAGWYAATGSGDIFYKSSAGLFTIAGSYVADPVTPTLSSRVIGTNGTTLTLTGSASLSVGAGGNGGFDVDCNTAGSGITATYSSGAPGTDLVYTLGTTVNSGDTCDLDYTQPGNGIEATTGGADLASITSAAITNNSTQSSGEGATCSGYVICQNFEGTGYDNSETWTTSGTVDPDSTSPALRGSQSVRASASSYLYRNITAMTGDVSVHMIVQLSTISANTGQFIFGANTGGDTRFGVVLQTTGGVLRGYHGNASCDTSAGAIAANTPLHIWVDRTRGTGSNGTLALYVSSNGTKPASASCSLSNGDGAFDIDRLVLYSLGDTATKHYDQVLVKSSVIGSVVP